MLLSLVTMPFANCLNAPQYEHINDWTGNVIQILIVMTSNKGSPCLLLICPFIPHLGSLCSPPSLLKVLLVVKSTNPGFFPNMFFLIFVPLWGKFRLNPLLWYMQPKQWWPGNSPGGVHRFVARHYPSLGKQFLTEPECMNAIWLALAPIITCCTSHVGLSCSSFVLHIAKGRTKSSVISLLLPPKAPDM